MESNESLVLTRTKVFLQFSLNLSFECSFGNDLFLVTYLHNMKQKTKS